MRKPFVALVLLSQAATAACAQEPGLHVPTPAGVIQAVTDCADATSPSGVDIDRLIELGYNRATAESEGETLDMGSLVILGKGGGSPVILTGEPGNAANRTCMMTGAMDSGFAFDGLLEVMQDAFGAPTLQDENHYFRVGADMAAAAQTRAAGGNSFRIVVVEMETTE